MRKYCRRHFTDTYWVEDPGYEPVPGVSLGIWPSGRCSKNLTDEFHELKDQYGFSRLRVDVSQIDAAHKAGWDNSQLLVDMSVCDLIPVPGREVDCPPSATKLSY